MNNEINIDIPRCLKEIVKNWYWLVLSAVIVTGIVFLRTYNTPVTYVAKSTLYSSVYGSTKESVQEASNMKSYAELIYTEKVCERARVILNTTYGYSGLSASQISNMISVSSNKDSVIITVSAVSRDPQQAIMVANAVAQSFEIEAKSITGDTTVQVLDVASSVSLSGRPGYIKKCLIALAAALLIPMIFISLKEIFSDNVYHVEDASLKGELDIIGVIPFEKEV